MENIVGYCNYFICKLAWFDFFHICNGKKMDKLGRGEDEIVDKIWIEISRC